MTVTVRKPAHDAICSNLRGSELYLSIGERIRESNVAADVSGKKKNVLLHVCDETANLFERHLTNVNAVYEDPPALRIVESHQQIRDRGLPSARMTNECDCTPGLGKEAHTFENPFGFAVGYIPR